MKSLFCEKHNMTNPRPLGEWQVKAIADQRWLLLHEMRPAAFEDVTDYTDDIVSDLGEWIRGDDKLYGNSTPNDPVLPVVPSPVRDALKKAIADYVRVHVNLVEALWQPTGRKVIIQPDGRLTEGA